MYEPSTIKCRVLVDSKEKIARVHYDLCTLGSEAEELCDQLNSIYKDLDFLHEAYKKER